MGVNDTLIEAASDRPEDIWSRRLLLCVSRPRPSGAYVEGGTGMPLLFDEGDERPDTREADLLDRYGCEIRLREEARQIEIGLEPDVHGERRDGACDFCEQRIGAAEM